MAINTALNRDPFATGGVMDAPDKAVTIAMNKIALGMQLTPQELGRLATRQKLEQQSNAVAAQKASFQSLIGQAPIDVRSYKGSMWAGANTQEDQANAALEARFGKRVPGQIDISYGGQQPAATPQYTPAYAPATGLLGQAQEAQSDVRAAQAPTVSQPMLGGQSYGIGSNPIPQSSATGVGYGFAPRPANAAAQRPSALATGLGEFGVGATTPLTSAFNPGVFSTTPSPSAPATPSAGPLPPKYVSGFEQAAGAAPIPLEAFLARGKLDGVAPAKNASLRANEAIADAMRASFQGVANPFNPANWTESGRYAVYTPETKQLADLQSRYAALEDKSSPTAINLQKKIIRASTGSDVPITSLAGNLIKLPGAIGGQQQVPLPEVQKGYRLGSGPLAIDSASSAGIIPPPLSEAVSAEGVPFTPAEKAQMQASEQAQMRAQQINAPIQQAGAVQAPQVAAPKAPQAITPEAAPQQQQMAADAQDFSGFTQDTRPTRIYAFGNNASVEPSPIQQAKNERVKPLETSFDKALAASPSGRAAAMAEARFASTEEQRFKKELKLRNDEYIKNVGNALALNPSLDISNLPKLDQNAARVMAAEIKKKTGLDEKQNSDAFGAAIKEAGSIPVGDEKISTIMSSFVRNGGSVTPEFVDKVQGLYGAPISVTEMQGYTIVRAGKTYRILDRNKKPFDVNRAEKDQFVDLLTDSVLKYPSWESLPNEEKNAFIKLNLKHAQPVDAATGKIPSAKQIWNQHQDDFSTSLAPVKVPAPTTAKPAGAKPAANSQSVDLGGGWTQKTR